MLMVRKVNLLQRIAGGGGALENERKGWAKYEKFKISEKPLCRKNVNILKCHFPQKSVCLIHVRSELKVFVLN